MSGRSQRLARAVRLILACLMVALAAAPSSRPCVEQPYAAAALLSLSQAPVAATAAANVLATSQDRTAAASGVALCSLQRASSAPLPQQARAATASTQDQRYLYLIRRRILI